MGGAGRRASEAGERGGARLSTACRAERGNEMHRRKLAATLVLADHELDRTMSRVAVVERQLLRRRRTLLVGASGQKRRRGLCVHGASQADDHLVRGRGEVGVGMGWG